MFKKIVVSITHCVTEDDQILLFAFYFNKERILSQFAVGLRFFFYIFAWPSLHKRYFKSKLHCSLEKKAITLPSLTLFHSSPTSVRCKLQKLTISTLTNNYKKFLLVQQLLNSNSNFYFLFFSITSCALKTFFQA